MLEGAKNGIKSNINYIRKSADLQTKYDSQLFKRRTNFSFGFII